MPMLFHVDHKVIVSVTFAATASVAVFSWYKLWSLKRKLKRSESVYETVRYLNEYLVFHYGSVDEVIQWDFGPKSAVDFPKRCAEICLKHSSKKTGLRRALDIGCAVGRSTFELSRSFDEVIGVDLSKSFIDTCNLLRENGQLRYSIAKQGDILKDLVAVVDPAIERDKVQFQCGDACSLPLDIGQFDCVLAANLIDRLHTPQAFLDRLPSLVTAGGILVITTPYTLLREFTPRDNWIGGWKTNGNQEYTAFDGLKDRLEPNFDIISTEDMPFLIRETERKFQWVVSHVSVWRRRE